jgi:hypothetical protein
MIDMSYVIDRFEGSFALCEDMETRITVPVSKSDLPKEAKAGDVLDKDGDTYTVNVEETKTRKERIQKLFESLWS